MDENSAMIEQILREFENEDGKTTTSTNGKLSIEKYSEDRRRRAAEAPVAAEAEAAVSSAVSNRVKVDDEDDSDTGGVEENGAVEIKKVKPKKPKKPKVTVAEAASKIEAGDLSAFLIDITSSYETQQDIQLMRFADYFGRAFASVNAAQFPWLKLFKESTVSKLVDADLASHQGATKGSKKVPQPALSKSLVAIFVVLSMALRRKPDVLISLAPKLREDPKYQGQDKFPITAIQGDLAVGLYMWVQYSAAYAEWQVKLIISSLKARPILANGAVRKGDRLVPLSALDILMRLTFPAPSARVKATERFEAIYPTLKEVALAGSPGSKAMKQVAQQILSYAVKAAGEGLPELSKEASDVFIWCLTQNPECYKQWNEKAEINADASLNEADKYCRLLLGHFSKGHGCLKGALFASIALVAGVAVMSQNVQSLSLDKLSAMFNLS
ncbi:hypothetical protein GOBAR_DD31407 [Gossypium barbadense]|nr:hypothetical protein GOBAR_DD31407 [Gossypium barbadense]